MEVAFSVCDADKGVWTKELTMKATKTLTLAAVAALLGVSLLYAQGSGAPRLDPATAVSLEGAVVSFTNEPGTPSTLVVDDAEMGKIVVRLGPSWYLDGIGFTAAAGESVKVAAQQCTDCTAGHIAVRVENLATGAVAELRDEEGLPVWRGSGRAKATAESGPGWRQGRGKGCGGQAVAAGGCGQGRGGKGCGHGCGQGCGGQGCGGQGCARGR